jgi:hypothetical protein
MKIFVISEEFGEYDSSTTNINHTFLCEDETLTLDELYEQYNSYCIMFINNAKAKYTNLTSKRAINLAVKKECKLMMNLREYLLSFPSIKEFSFEERIL